MFRTFVALLIALVFASSASAIVETTRITAVAATASQNSNMVTTPPTVKGMIVVMDVTAGAVLLLDLKIQAFSPGANAWVTFSADCPSTGGITGVSTTVCFIGPDGSNVAGHYAANDFLVVLPDVFRILVTHGNATAATYTVHTQWVRR